MKALCKAYYDSPIGVLEIAGGHKGIYSLTFIDADFSSNLKAQAFEFEKLPDCLKECICQLDEYFRGGRTTFTIKYIMEGTPFQNKVWSALTEIPFGSTLSYAMLARMTGNKKAVRAVGGANAKNRLPIIIPCHRVIGSDSGLTGYAFGLWRKKWLLEHELSVKGKTEPA